MRKISIIALSLLISANSYAQNAACLGKFCIGAEIIDNYGDSGKIVGFDAAKNLIYYTKQNESSPSSASQSGLSVKVENSQFATGKTVIDNYNEIGKVVAAYDNGKVAYLRENYSSPSTILGSLLGVQVPALNGLKTGMRVIDAYNEAGVVKIVFSNGKVQYLKDNYSSPSVVNAGLSTVISTMGALSSGTVVIDSYNELGKIVTIYQDGRVEYLKEGYSSSNIAKSGLVPLVASYQDLAPNTVVIDSYNETGVVQKAFADGRIQYLKQSYSSPNITPAKNLSARVTSTASGLTAGILAIDNYNEVGTIEQVFKNGKIEFLRQDYSSTNIVTSLAREVSTSAAGYLKNADYAYNTSSVGRVLHFFENNKVQMNDLESRKMVTGQLFREVQGLNDLAKGDLVIDSALVSSPVERIFENRTVVIKAPNDGADSMKIADEASLAKVADVWINILQMGHYTRKFNSGVGIKKSLYPQLRTQIFSLLDDKNSNLNKRQINEIKAQLPEAL